MFLTRDDVPPSTVGSMFCLQISSFNIKLVFIDFVCLCSMILFEVVVAESHNTEVVTFDYLIYRKEQVAKGKSRSV